MSHANPDNGPHLVVDIGGGSTELIAGEGPEPRRMESIHLGCVGMSRRHFADRRITSRSLEAAVTAARLELEPVEAQFRAKGCQVYGSPGTIRVIGAVIREAGWSADVITAAALEKLQDALLGAGSVRRLRLAGLSADRLPVFPGGVATLLAVFGALGIEAMRVSESARKCPEALPVRRAGKLKLRRRSGFTLFSSCARRQKQPAAGTRCRCRDSCTNWQRRCPSQDRSSFPRRR